ncbi:MAG: hypothetical protein AAGD01_20680 [Acidobacteriota bacterium]
MPFQYILRELLSNNEDAIGALFLDESGEAVDLAYSDLTPYQMRVVGAYLGIYLRQLESLAAANHLGEPQMMHIAKETLHIYAVPVDEGYCVALIQRNPALVGLARRHLLTARSKLRQALFES